MPAAEKYTLTAYPIVAADADNVQAMLKKMHPDVQAVLDAKNSRLLILAHPLEACADQVVAGADPGPTAA